MVRLDLHELAELLLPAAARRGAVAVLQQFKFWHECLDLYKNRSFFQSGNTRILSIFMSLKPIFNGIYTQFTSVSVL
jgi:hypothetical protein